MANMGSCRQRSVAHHESEEYPGFQHSVAFAGDVDSLSNLFEIPARSAFARAGLELTSWPMGKHRLAPRSSSRLHAFPAAWIQPRESLYLHGMAITRSSTTLAVTGSSKCHLPCSRHEHILVSRCDMPFLIDDRATFHDAVARTFQDDQTTGV